MAQAPEISIEWRRSDAPVPYRQALAEQEARNAAIAAGEADELVWLLEHPPVYTAGTSAPPGELLDQILATPVVLCDQVAWSWLGVSMAGWNAILSLGIVWLWWRAYASSSASQYR